MNIGIGLGILGVIATAIGFPFGYFIARRSLQLPDPRFAIDFDVILEPNDWLRSRGLTMTIDDHSIQSLSRSRVAFWNHRGVAIRGQDIVASAPLRIQLPEGGTILQVRTLSISQPETDLALTLNSTDEEFASIAFDFLNAGDGAIFEVVHQGTQEPTVKGLIRNAKLRDCGQSRLDTEAIEAIGKSRMRRYFDYASRSQKIAFAFGILVGFVFIWLAVGSASPQPGHLINPDSFNLRTMTGQANFSQAVQNNGSFSTDSSIAATAVFSIGALYAFGSGARSFLNNTRRIVPKSVVTTINDDITQSDTDISAADGEQSPAS